MSNLWPMGRVQPRMQCRMARNAAQHKPVNLLKVLLSFTIKFCYLDMYIFYIRNHKLGTCSTILKYYRKGRCIIRVIMWGLYAYLWWQMSHKLWMDIFFAHQFSLVFVYLVCGPKQLFFFQCGPETPKGWTPWIRMLSLMCVCYISLPSKFLCVASAGAAAFSTGEDNQGTSVNPPAQPVALRQVKGWGVIFWNSNILSVPQGNLEYPFLEGYFCQKSPWEQFLCHI